MRAWRLRSSVRLYGALLWLYPAGFRAHFGGEMLQIFRDRRQEEAEDGGPGAYFAFWFRTFGDLVVSLPAVWQRELLRVTQIELAVWELADSLAVPVIVVGTLLVEGFTWGILTRNMTQSARMLPTQSPPTLEPLIAAGIAACALGIAGAVSALVLARSNRTERPWIKL